MLCLDKTGTLTTGRMKVAQAVPLGIDENELRRELARFLGAFDDKTGTLEALRAWCPPEDGRPTEVLPFSSARKKSAAAFPDGVTLTMGAPNFVLDPVPEALQKRIDALTAEGLRVMVLTRAAGDAPAVCIALLALEDELRPGCAETLRRFREGDVRLKVISGDDPATVSVIAARLGLEGAEKYVDASTLDDDALRACCADTTVFGRVTPARKRLLVESLKAQGLRVAMTGDGVNDIPALKAADCSIAVAGGADAARHAAQITIPGDGFPLLPEVVGEGRRVVGNITRAASLFLVKTLSTFLISLLTLFLPVAYPFQPIQLTLVSTLTIGAPSFLLSLEKNNRRISGDFLQKVLLNAVPGASAVALAALLCMAGVPLRGLDSTVCSTLAALCALVLGLLVLVRLCLPLTPMRAAVAVGAAVCSAGAVLLLGGVFRITLSALTADAVVWGLTALAAGAALWLLLGLLLRPARKRAELR